MIKLGKLYDLKGLNSLCNEDSISFLPVAAALLFDPVRHIANNDDASGDHGTCGRGRTNESE